jgi:hypothetical protein
MQSTYAQLYTPTVQIPVMAVAELQDNLMIVLNDLQRLEGLINHAADVLLDRFSVANAGIAAVSLDNSDVRRLQSVRTALHSAVTELQFQDMASQLIIHTSKVIKGCADRLASEAMELDENEGQSVVQTIPDRPNPVTQDEMDAGTIELF